MTDNGWQRTASVFVLGLGVGAGLGLLLAPKSGEETRDEIVGTVKDGMDGLVAQGNQLGRRAQKKIEDVKEHLNAAVEAGGQAFRESKNASS